MSLYDNHSQLNLLPKDGIVHYYGKILPEQDALFYLEKLLYDIAWKHDEAIIYGKHIVTKRKVAWYGDQNYAYTYSNTTKQALPWTTELAALKKLVEQHTATQFNSCLLNLYHDGDEGMAWHSDDEKSLQKNSSIASLSFGAERKFSFKHKSTKESLSLLLENGSLLLIKGTTQSHWWHSLPKTKKVKQPRINLTFRTMAEIL
jgi:alkylated DNA repair dioxygenase AlkB